MNDSIMLTALEMAYDKATDENLWLRIAKDKGMSRYTELLKSTTNRAEIRAKYRTDMKNWDDAIETSSEHCRKINGQITERIKENQLK